MTSGAMKQGVPQNVLRARYMRWPQELSLRCGHASPDPGDVPAPDAWSLAPIADAMDARASSSACGAQGSLRGELPGTAASAASCPDLRQWV